MSEPQAMILRPYRFGDAPSAMVYGARRHKADCGHDAWIAPSSLTFLAENPVIATMCTDCAPDGSLDVRMAPGAREELEDRVGTAWADQLVAQARDAGKKGRLK